jgi:flagellar basal body-associated protein FliL
MTSKYQTDDYDRSNEVYYHHTRNVIILVAFTVLMAALTCLFAYLFDQVSGINKVQSSNQEYTGIKLLQYKVVEFSTYL